MAMHEFEDLVEASVRMLAHSTRHSRHELRALYWNLYEFEALWDTGFTQLRVLDLLLAAHYTYRFDLSEHPDYQRDPDVFQSITGFSFLNVHPQKKWDEEQNPVAGYCDVNSQLWSRFVQQGVLIGEDALSVERQKAMDVASVVVEDAVAQQDFRLIAQWYALLAPYLLFTFADEEVPTLMTLPSLTSLKHHYYHTQAHRIQLGDYGAFRRPTPEEIDAMERGRAVLSWWFQPL